MNTQNLYHYTKTGAFLHDLQKSYDLVIREKIPDMTQLPPSSTTEHITFAQLWYDMRPTGDIIARMTKAGSVLLILDALTSASISSLVAALPKDSDITIINMWAWLTGIINKHTVDAEDIWLMLPTMQVYEPLDAHHFLRIVTKSWHIYVRVAHDEIPEHLFAEQDPAIYEADYISMQSFGYTGIGWTVISSGSLLPYVSQALQYADTNNGKKYDLFVCTAYTTTISDALLHSIKHTGKLIVIHDQKDAIALQQFIQTVLEKNWLTDIQVFYKQPQYATLTTIFAEYLHELAWMGSENLAQYLISLG